MAKNPLPTVVLLSAPGTLNGVDSLLERGGARLVRIETLRLRALPPSGWLPRIAKAPPVDTVVVTSRAAVGAGVEPWRRSASITLPMPEFWAVGPGTAQALRAAGVRRVRRPRTVGALAVAEALRGKAPRNVFYFRSDRAGPRLARALRAEGHRVTDLVVYRLDAPPRLTVRALRDLATADLLVAASPSSISNLRRGLDSRSFGRLRRNARLAVLGERSRRSAQGHGFRRVSVAPSTGAARFARHLLQELRDAPT
jgi:uroporphyrinogen-III synthase